MSTQNTHLAAIKNSMPAVFGPGQVKSIQVAGLKDLDSAVMTVGWQAHNNCGLNRTSFYVAEVLSPEDAKRFQRTALKELAAEETHHGFFSRKEAHALTVEALEADVASGNFIDFTL